MGVFYFWFDIINQSEVLGVIERKGIIQRVVLSYYLEFYIKYLVNYENIIELFYDNIVNN